MTHQDPSKEITDRWQAEMEWERDYPPYIEGQEAIDMARRLGVLLSKYADPTEGERDDVTPDEAEQMIRENLPEDHIYLTR